MVQPGSPAVARDLGQDSAAPPAPQSCTICTALGLTPPQLPGLAQVDRRHIPPLAISHAIFSRAPVPCQELEAPRGSSLIRGRITYTLQQVVCCTLVLRGCGVPQAVPRGDAFPTLLRGGSSHPAIDRSPMPPVSTSWALYEENAGLG